MRARTLLAAVALMLLSPAFVAHPAHAQAAPQIELGFTPNYLLPLSQGSPVYSPGDEMWGISNYNASVTVLLAYPNGTSAAPPLRLEPQRLGQLYQFADSAPLGNWRISVVEQTSVVNATFPVTTQVASIQPALEASTLSGSLLVQNFTIPPTGAYDIQACALGENSSAELIGVVLPAGAGGVMNMSINGKDADINVSGVAQPFALWQELYAPYSFKTGGGIVTSSLLVAHTNEEVIAGNQTTRLKLPFLGGIPLRPGRYTLRTYVRAGSSLTVTEDEYLLSADAGWVSLSSCSSLTSVDAKNFQTASDLSSPASSWPRSLLTMYGSGGLEGYSVVKLPPTGAAVGVVLTMSNATLRGVGASVNGRDVQHWSLSSGTIYVIAGEYPAQITISLDFGVATETENVTVPAPYWRGSASFMVGSLDAFATRGGQPLPNATFTLSSGGKASALTANKQGRISAVLPPGNYTVTARYQGAAISQNASVSRGRVTSLQLEVEPPSFPTILVTEAAVGVVGVGFVVIVWRRYLRQRSLYE